MVSFSKVDTAERVLGLHLGLLVVWEQGPAGGVTCVCRCANNMCAAHHRSCTTEGGALLLLQPACLASLGPPQPPAGASLAGRRLTADGWSDTQAASKRPTRSSTDAVVSTCACAAASLPPWSIAVTNLPPWSARQRSAVLAHAAPIT